MLAEERYKRITNLIHSDGTVTVQDLVEKLGISESTARRDLNELDKMGQVEKVRGGAVAIDSGTLSSRDDDVLLRQTRNIGEKSLVARYAASLIEPTDFVYLDAGLYADFGMQVYYTLAAIYGLLVWKFGKKHNQQSEEMPITHIRHSLLLPSLLLFIVAWGGIYLILIHFTNSTVPVLDSFGNALPGYLFYSFEEVHVIDSRYFTKNMVEYVKENQITDILFANNIFKAYSSGTYAKYIRYLKQTNGLQKPIIKQMADSRLQKATIQDSATAVQAVKPAMPKIKKDSVAN